MPTEKRAIRTDQAPTPTGPFNQAIRVGNLVFTAGQAGRNRDTGQMGDIREQTDWALRNIAAILAAAGTVFGGVHATEERGDAGRDRGHCSCHLNRGSLYLWERAGVREALDSV